MLISGIIEEQSMDYETKDGMENADPERVERL